MKQFFTGRKSVFVTTLFYVLLIASVVTIVNACHKSTPSATNSRTTESLRNIAGSDISTTKGEFSQNAPITTLATVAAIRSTGAGSAQVMFFENEQILNVSNAALLAALQSAYNASAPVKITFNPWTTAISAVYPATNEEISARSATRPASHADGFSLNVANLAPDAIDTRPELGAINLTTTNLTAVIPDMTTALEMFNYISAQCCRIPGPYAVDYCITFQYCPDGCYARAHKMCWILNNKYHYATQKIFSFANAGSDQLCVKAERWGGCCINWWYHVAPLVTIRTSTGPKAFVFDPAMFDQPVLLSQWLHAQENPACAGSATPHVSMINVQPTTSYSPSSYTGLTFDTDPTYSSTDTTLVNYRNLVSCP